MNFCIYSHSIMFLVVNILMTQKIGTPETPISCPILFTFIALYLRQQNGLVSLAYITARSAPKNHILQFVRGNITFKIS